jgi:type 1 glutamine amidotransferase
MQWNSLSLRGDLDMYDRLPLIVSLMLGLCSSAAGQAPHRALIIDGQNNHVMWPKTTVMMKKYLEQTGLFSVEVARTKYTWRGDDLLAKYPLEGLKTTARPEPTADPDFKPEFSKYDVVVSNFGWRAAPWPQETQESIDAYVRGGGGLVIVHAANNAFGDWPEYNRMIGIGGWGDRNEQHGPYVYYDESGELIRDTSAGRGGSHGKQHEFQVVIREPEHPIVKGMPREWKHATDELYDRLRGPAEQMQVLATAYADESTGGSGRHEPMILTIRYGKGRIFHTPMGHADYSQECVGFITTLQRGTEWAATGRVTQAIPADFPSQDAVSQRTFAE